MALFTTSGGPKEQKTEKQLDDEAENALGEPEINGEYELPNFNLTEQRYEEYEALKGPKGTIYSYLHVHGY